jgi:carboxyl-terminal processing protease
MSKLRTISHSPTRRHTSIIVHVVSNLTLLAPVLAILLILQKCQVEAFPGHVNVGLGLPEELRMRVQRKNSVDFLSRRRQTSTPTGTQAKELQISKRVPVGALGMGTGASASRHVSTKTKNVSNRDSVSDLKKDRIQIKNKKKKDPMPILTPTLMLQVPAKSLLAAVLATTIVATPLTITTTTSIEKTATPASIFLPPSLSLIPSRAWSLTEQQILVNTVWTEVSRQYVDQTFNGLGEEEWRKKRLEAVTKVSNVGPDETQRVYSTIRTMLSYLGDPYTRFLTPEQFETITAYARGSPAKAGIGVQLMGDPATGKIVVLNTIPDGPAAEGGVLPGDIIVQVDGMDVSDGATAEVVAAQCRGEAGTEVTLAVQHGGDGKPDDTVTRFLMKRSQIKVESVESSVVSSKNGDKVGLIRLSSFNLGTEQKVIEALNSIRHVHVSALVLDLRGNAGGYMPAGVDCAKLFLPPNTRVVSEVDKAGRATIYINDGVGSETKLPLYVLVDNRTASASEILTAALQDNHRATIVGTKTFGKGRIQNILELQDGSGVAVTKAKYITPQGKDIHGVGITPDIETNICGADVKSEMCVKSVI